MSLRGIFRNNVSLCICLIFIGLWAGSASAQNLQSAQIAARNKQWDRVIEILGPHVDKMGRDEIHLLAQAHSAKGNHALAIKTYEASLATNPKDAAAKRQIGVEYTLMNKDKEAMGAFREALAINPAYEAAYLDIAKIYERREYKNAGRESKDSKYEQRLLYQDLIAQEKVGRKPTYISKLCELTALGGHYLTKSGSLEYCPEGIKLSPQDPSNYVYLAMTYKETGEAKKALEYFKMAGDKFPASELAQMSMANYYADDKNFVLAYKHFRQASLANPKSMKALVGWATSSLEIQKPDEAYKALEQACALDRSASVQVRKADAMMRQQKNTEWAQKFDTLSDRCGLRQEI